MLEVFSVTETRQAFLPLIDRVEDELYRFMVTKHGKPVAVVISYEEYSRMMETLKLIEDGGLARDVRQGLVEAGQGKLIALKDAGESSE